MKKLKKNNSNKDKLIVFVILNIVFILFLYFNNINIKEETTKSPKIEDSRIPLDAGGTELPLLEQYFKGVINVKFKEGYDVVSKENAFNFVSQITSRNLELAKVLEVNKIFKAKPGLKNYELKKQIGLDRWVSVNVLEEINVIDESYKWSLLPEIEKAEPVFISKPTSDEIPLDPEQEVPTSDSSLIIPNDPLFISQWHHKNTGRNPTISPPGIPDADMDTPEAWYIEKGNIVVAVPDVGIKWWHEDLVDNIWRNLGEDIDNDGDVLEWSPSQNRYVFDSGDINNFDNDNNGFVDDFIGWDFSTDDNNPQGAEHGTFTAGSFGAKPNNNKGVAGVCWNCKIIALRYSRLASSIVYAVDNGAKVISMSIYGDYSGATADAIDYATLASVLLVAASGNTNQVSEVNGLCKSEKILCVTAITQGDKLKDNSFFGPQTDVGAPGQDIYTTNNDDITKYSKHGATSIATPIAAGVAAMITSVNPSLSYREILSIMQTATDPFIDTDKYAGNGRINALKAINLAKETQVTHSFPISLINALDTTQVSNNLLIYGTAASPQFLKYQIFIGQGIYPTSWNLIHEDTNSVTNGLLFSLNLVPLQLSTYQIKLVTYDINGQYAVDTFPFTKQMLFDREGWPKNFNAISAPSIGDLDKDGYPDIIFSSSDRKINAVNKDGSFLFGWPQEIAGNTYYTKPSLGDIDNDGYLNVIVSSYVEGKIYVFDRNGNLLSGWPYIIGDKVKTSTALADLDKDGYLDIVVGSEDKKLYALDRNGLPLPGWPVNLGSNDVASSPAIGDIDSDGFLEIIVGLRFDGGIVAINHDGSIVEGWPSPVSESIYSSPALGDVNNDGMIDIIFGSNNGNIYALDYSGVPLVGWPIPIGDHVEPAPVLGDLNGDGKIEIVIGILYGDLGKIFAFNGDGSNFEGWPVVTNYYISNPPLIENLDNDIQLEILVDKVYDYDGTPLFNGNFWVTEPVIGSPTFIDIDGDGKLELIMIPYWDGRIFIMETVEPNFISNEWSQFRHDTLNSGLYQLTNKIKNPSFEIDTGIDFYPNWNGEDSIAANNKPDGYVTSSSGLLDNSIKYQGSKSLKIQVTNNRGYSYQDIQVEYNKIYRVSGYVKTDCNDINCYGTILSECKNINHQPIGDYNTCKLNINPVNIRRLYNDNDWTYIEFDVENNRQDAKFLRVLCYNTPGPLPVGSGVVWCDSFNVIEIPRGGGIGSPIFLKSIVQGTGD